MLMLFLLHVFSLCCLREYAHAAVCTYSILIHIGILMEFCLELLVSILCVAFIFILQIPIWQLKTSILLMDYKGSRFLKFARPVKKTGQFFHCGHLSLISS